MRYYELWNILVNWRREFTTKEFSSVFISPNPNKVLHDMTKKDLLERIEWGRYKVNSPAEYLAKKVNITKAYALLKRSGMKYAFTGPDAVFFWTKGGYIVDRFFGFYPIHLKIKNQDLIKWKKFFKSEKQRFFIEGNEVKETLFGIFYVLYVGKDFKVETIDNYRVQPLKETIEFCQKRIYSYEPALEMMDELHDLGLNIKNNKLRINSRE